MCCIVHDAYFPCKPRFQNLALSCAQLSRYSSPNNISSHVHIASRAGGKSLAFWQTLEFDLIHWAGLSSEHTYSASELN